MNNFSRALIVSALLAAGSVVSAGVAQAAVNTTVEVIPICTDAAHSGIDFYVKNGAGQNYSLVVTANGTEVRNDSGVVSDQDWQTIAYRPVGEVYEATFTLAGTPYHGGPIVFAIDGESCAPHAPVHDIRATPQFLCIEGAPTINLVIENHGDYTEPLSGMFVDESFDTELGAGMSTNGQKQVAAGGHYEFNVKSGQVTLAEDEGTMPDACGTQTEIPDDEIPDDEASAGGLPETGSSQTMVALLAGLLLALGVGMVRFTTRRDVVWVEIAEATDEV